MVSSLDERVVLQFLKRLLERVSVCDAIDATVTAIESWLRDHPEELFGWKTLPLDLFAELPSGIHSAWVFVIRPGLPAEKHRHPNSHQFTLSYRGEGDLQTWDGSYWQSNKGLISIPPNVWHRPVVNDYWVVFSLHSATESDLIEELEPADGSKTQRNYAPGK